jgi:hypothetical protein
MRRPGVRWKPTTSPSAAPGASLSGVGEISIHANVDYIHLRVMKLSYHVDGGTLSEKVNTI